MVYVSKHFNEQISRHNHINASRTNQIQHSCVTSKTSSSRILVPKTVMPSVLMTAWSLLLSGLVNFFLQSTIMVTLFFSTLMATRCHLCNKGSKGVQICSQIRTYLLTNLLPIKSIFPRLSWLNSWATLCKDAYLLSRQHFSQQHLSEI